MDLDGLTRMMRSSGQGSIPRPYSNIGPTTGYQVTQSAAQSIRPGSIVIAVMGVTGSGKSSFIQYFSSQAVIGHNLESSKGTTDVQVHYCKLDNGPGIYLVDTPGFDDTHLSDTEVLRKVANWFSETYGAGIKMSGVVYLHRIFDTRLSGVSMRNLNMFKKLVGRDSLSNVVLATTMWDSVPPTEWAKAEAREQELKGTESFWKDMIAYGSKVVRHDSGRRSALSIVQSIISKNRLVALDIQKEMVDNGLTLEQTSAGQALQKEIEKARIEFEQRMSKLQSDFRATLLQQEQEHQRRLSESRASLQEKMQRNRETADLLTQKRMQRRQQYRDAADNKIQRMADNQREQAAAWQEAVKKTTNEAIYRHPECYNHYPGDSWHQRNCRHPMWQ